jgi:hypothetical protein
MRRVSLLRMGTKGLIDIMGSDEMRRWYFFTIA